MTITETALPLTAGTWQADPAHSTVEFVVRHLGFSKVRGRFHDFEASLVVGEQLAATAVEARVALASVDTGNSDRDAHLRSADILDTDAHPDMVFTSTGVTADDDGYLLDGELTIGGVTRAVRFDAELEGVGGDPWGGTRAGLSARGEISRKDFGIDFNIPVPTGGVVVSDNVKIELEVQFVAPTD